MTSNINDVNDTTQQLIKIQQDRSKIFVSNFKPIDREEEDKLVMLFQETQDPELLKRLYMMREPTLRVWVKKFNYLNMEEEDLFIEMALVWMKCINSYEYTPKIRVVKSQDGKLSRDKNGNVVYRQKRTPFNTFLFTSLKNHLRNLYKKKHSQKRVNESGVPYENILLSLEDKIVPNTQHYDESRAPTLKEILLDTSKPSPFASTSIQDLICHLANGDEEVYKALMKFVSDSHYKTLTSVCQYDDGHFLVQDQNDVNIFINNINSKKAKDRVVEMIDNSQKYTKGYILLNFKFDKNNNILSYEVKRKDTSFLRKIIKILKKYYQNQNNLNA